MFGVARLSGRLTGDLVLRSPQGHNCCGEYELDLRGNKIEAIENLGVTQNQFDCIDLSDNDVLKLEGFPLLPRLKTLLLNHNHIKRIGRKVDEVIPNLETLILTHNKLARLQDVDHLGCLAKLQRLSLLSNPVVTTPHYRLYVVHLLPALKMLDFRKVTRAEREQAAAMFGGEGGQAAAAAARSAKAAPGAAAAGGGGAAAKAGPTPEEITKIKAAIAAAQTMEEIAGLENALKGGEVPPGVLDNGHASQMDTD